MNVENVIKILADQTCEKCEFRKPLTDSNKKEYFFCINGKKKGCDLSEEGVCEYYAEYVGRY